MGDEVPGKGADEARVAGGKRRFQQCNASAMYNSIVLIIDDQVKGPDVRMSALPWGEKVWCRKNKQPLTRVPSQNPSKSQKEQGTIS